MYAFVNLMDNRAIRLTNQQFIELLTEFPYCHIQFLEHLPSQLNVICYNNLHDFKKALKHDIDLMVQKGQLRTKSAVKTN